MEKKKEGQQEVNKTEQEVVRKDGDCLSSVVVNLCCGLECSTQSIHKHWIKLLYFTASALILQAI